MLLVGWQLAFRERWCGTLGYRVRGCDDAYRVELAFDRIRTFGINSAVVSPSGLRKDSRPELVANTTGKEYVDPPWL